MCRPETVLTKRKYEDPYTSRPWLVPVERIELPTFGLQNLLLVNEFSKNRSNSQKFQNLLTGK